MIQKAIGLLTILGLMLLILTPQNNIKTSAATNCTKPASMMLTIDISDSMAGNPFPPYADREDAAKKISSKFVNKVDFSQDKMGLVFFAENPSLVSSLGSSKSTILSKISGYSSQHGTRIYAALDAAYAALPKNNTTTRYIIMPTDGKHYDDPGETADERDAKTIAAATTIKNAGVIIITVGIDDADDKLLNKVASPGYSYFATSSSQMENFFDVIADRVICTVKTSTPSPTKSAKPSSTPSGTPTPSPTSTPKPTPSLTLCESDNKCSDKQIGTYSLNVFSGKSSLNLGTTYWIKLTIEGRSDANDGTLVVQEKVNPTYFELVSPKTNIQLYKKTSTGTNYRTDIDCNTGSCISNETVNSIDISIPNLKANEEEFIYFQVKPIGSSEVSVDVDDNSSNIKYPQLAGTIPLDNTQVKIPNVFSFFQTLGGDTYSHADTEGSIKSSLPKDQFFTGTNNHLVLYKGSSANFGSGEVNSKNWQQDDYNISPVIEYESLYNQLKSQIVPTDIKGINSFINMTGDTIYLEQSASGNNNLTIGGGNWDNKIIQGKNVIIFVPGDLYITKSAPTSYSIANDGHSSLTFIVKGRIGIDPSVTKVEGMFLADGVIDTSCSIPADVACSPSLATSPANSTLNLEGYFYSSDALGNGGFKLDRKGVPNTTAGEIFKSRPDFYLAATQGLGRVQLSWRETI